MRTFLGFVVTILLAISTTAMARSTHEVVKQARAGDVASSYTLSPNGDLFRLVGKHRCQVTTRVTQLKIPQHPADPAAAYFVKDGDLHALLPPEAPARGCPRAETRLVVRGVRQHLLVTNADSPLNLLAIDGDGTFVAYSAGDAVARIAGARELAGNACFGQAGRSHSGYAAFVLDRYGSVTKVKGKQRGDKTDFTRAYASLDEFRTVNHVCE